MPSWSDLQDGLNRVEPDRRGGHIAEKLQESVDAVAERYDRNVLFENGPAAKSVISSNGRLWIKNMQMEVIVQQA